MSDKTKPQKKPKKSQNQKNQNTTKTPLDSLPKTDQTTTPMPLTLPPAPPAPPANQPTEEQEQERAEEQKRAKYFTDDIDKKLVDEDVKVAFIVIFDPKSKQPIVYSRGSTYHLAKVMCDMTRYFKTRLNQELEI